MVRAIDWTEVELTAREQNLGLGQSVLTGVSAVAARFEAFMVIEDDLVCLPGTYEWMARALRHYAAESRVMSVTAWTHRRVAPATNGACYFDGRAECWLWGAYARSWRGMSAESALEKRAQVNARERQADRWGADLPLMAAAEQSRNLWAVRWLYHHLQHDGLCLRPPRSLVVHEGVEMDATNAAGDSVWTDEALGPCPAPEIAWPAVAVHPDCAAKWRAIYPPTWQRRAKRVRTWLKQAVPERLRRAKRVLTGWHWFEGPQPDWTTAARISGGYEAPVILEKVCAAARAVKAGEAAYERDGCLFAHRDREEEVWATLESVAAQNAGRLRVVDFGGGLGSLFWQHRPELDGLEVVDWRVVEQENFVEVGQREFAEGGLSFHAQLETALAEPRPDVLLAATVLNYLPDPHAMLARLLAARIPVVILHNLALQDDLPDTVMVQHVPPEIYSASYPCWFLNRESFMRTIGETYEIERSYASTAVWDLGWRDFPSTGLVLRLKGAAE